MHLAQTYIETVHDRGKKELPLQKVYRNIENRELFLVAYGKLYSNKGAMTEGIDKSDTVDGMSLERMDRIINKLENGSYKWRAARRVEIPKKSGKLRPLGIPSWSDKLLQEVIRMVLEAYYEPQFSEYSHGFRPNRSCQTALQEIGKWRGTKWFIEGDIKGCFDNIDHALLLDIIEKQIKDKRLIKLLKKMLKAGYLQDWKYHNTYSGTPQGGVISPILTNIYLNELDKYVETELMPKYNKGKKKSDNPEYMKLTTEMETAKETGNRERYKALRKVRTQLPPQ